MNGDKRTQQAIWFVKDKLSRVELPIPTPEAHEVLIRNVCVGSNPKDWKFPRWIPNWESVEGNDVAGIVEQVGPCVSDFKVGDRVCALTKQKTHQKYGAYQEYSIAPESTTVRIDQAISFEDAATVPLAAITAALALFQQLELPQPNSSELQSQLPEITVVINGASSSVGFFTIQLALQAGFRVIGIAGKGEWLPRSVGCKDIVDYRNRSDEEIAAEVQSLNSELKYAVDCVSTGTTVGMLARALSRSSGSICSLLPTKYDQGATVRNSIGKVQEKDGATDCQLPGNTKLKRALIFDAHGPAASLASETLRSIVTGIAKGNFKPMPFSIMPRGLDSVVDGLKQLEEIKISATKLVYRIADTPGL